MRYFCTKEKVTGTCWHEFVPGEWDERFWSGDSLYMDDEMLYFLGLKQLFAEHIADYDRYGVTTVYPEDWERVCDAAEGEAAEAVAELADLAKKAFRESGTFTILGI